MEFMEAINQVATKTKWKISEKRTNECEQCQQLQQSCIKKDKLMQFIQYYDTSTILMH